MCKKSLSKTPSQEINCSYTEVKTRKHVSSAELILSCSFYQNQKKVTFSARSALGQINWLLVWLFVTPRSTHSFSPNFLNPRCSLSDNSQDASSNYLYTGEHKKRTASKLFRRETARKEQKGETRISIANLVFAGAQELGFLRAVKRFVKHTCDCLHAAYGCNYYPRGFCPHRAMQFVKAETQHATHWLFNNPHHAA